MARLGGQVTIRTVTPAEAAVLTALDRSISWLSVVAIGAVFMTWREGVKRGRY